MQTVPIPDENPLRCDDCTNWADIAVKSNKTDAAVDDAELFLCLPCARLLRDKLGKTIVRNKIA